MKIRNIAVFAGRHCKTQLKDIYYPLAFETGKMLAKNNFIVVTGGGDGLMDEVSRGAFENGGRTYGICYTHGEVNQSDHLSDREDYPNLIDRQQRLVEMGDAYIALPGGIGTVYEISEVITRKLKDEIDHLKPLIIIGDYFNPFMMMLDKMYQEEFLLAQAKNIYHWVKTPSEALDILHRHT